VDQVDSAVSQIEKVTQQNASGAEESASPAEEMSAQADTVMSIVREIASVVHGDRRSTNATDGVHPPSGGHGRRDRPQPADHGGNKSSPPPQTESEDPASFLALEDSRDLAEF
jgi:hypothetical protein